MEIIPSWIAFLTVIAMLFLGASFLKMNLTPLRASGVGLLAGYGLFRIISDVGLLLHVDKSFLVVIAASVVIGLVLGVERWGTDYERK
jgi:hypothetical protein